MNDSIQRKTGAILSYVAIALNTLIQILYTPLLIRMLGQSEYGLYSLVASIIGYLTILDLGFGNAIVVYTAKYKAQEKEEEEKRLHGMFKVVFIVIGITAALLGLILFFNVENIFGSTMTNIEIRKMKIMMLILSFNLMITFAFNIYSCIITAYEKFVFQKILSIIGSILKPLLMIPLLFLGYKSITMCIVITVINLIVVLSNYHYCRFKLNLNPKYKGFDKSVFKTILGYSIWIFIGTIVDKVNWSVDNFVLGAVSGTTAVSVYSVATTFNTLFINLSTAISGILLPKISKMIAKQSSMEKITDEFIKVGRLQLYIVFLMFTGFVLFGKEFILLWIGKGFKTSYYVTILLVLPMCIALIQSLGISIRQSMNKHRFAAIVNIIVAIINVIISIPLSIRFGAIGAATGTCFGIFLTCILNSIYYYKVLKIGMGQFWKNIFKLVCILIIPFVIILMMKKYVIISNWISFILVATVYLLIYCIVSYSFCMNKYEKSIISNVIIKLRRRKL